MSEPTRKWLQQSTRSQRIRLYNRIMDRLVWYMGGIPDYLTLIACGHFHYWSILRAIVLIDSAYFAALG